MVHLIQKIRQEEGCVLILMLGTARLEKGVNLTTDVHSATNMVMGLSIVEELKQIDQVTNLEWRQQVQTLSIKIVLK